MARIIYEFLIIHPDDGSFIWGGADYPFTGGCNQDSLRLADKATHYGLCIFQT